MSTTTEIINAGEGAKKSDAVIAATTLVEAGFPINTVDGDQILAHKNPDGTLEGEDGTTYEASEDPHIVQPVEEAPAARTTKSTTKSDG